MNNWSITIVLLGSYLVFSMIYFAVFGFSPQSLQTQIQYSARTSFLIFALTFSAYPIFKIRERNLTRWLLYNRKYFGVSFACIQFYHLSLLIIKDNLYESVFAQLDFISLTVGIIGYSFIAIMLITSFPFISKYLDEEKWPRLHTVGGYVILSIFTIFYFRLISQEIIYLALFIIAVLLWVLRMSFKVIAINKGI